MSHTGTQTAGADTHGHDGHGHDGHGHDGHGRDTHAHDGHGHAHGAAPDRVPSDGAAGVWARLTHLVRPHSHDHADRTDAALESTDAGIRAVRTSLWVLGATAVAQGAVVAASGSVALLADMIHNLSDGLTALPLWLAFVLARRPPSRRFTYGLGRVEDLAGLVVLLMIAGSAVVAGWESLRRLGDPRPVQYLPAVIGAGLVGFLGNETVAVYRIRVGRRIGSAALVADGKHAQADGITSLGVVVGALGVAAGWRQADPVVGLLITAAILVVLAGATRDVGRRLLDGVDVALTERVEVALGSADGVRAVHDLRLRWLGHRLHAEAQVVVDAALDLPAAGRILADATGRARAAVPQLDRVVLRPGIDGSSLGPHPT